MRVVEVQRTEVEAHRQRQFEAWQRYEEARLLRNELTDASERLTIPMKNKIPFVFGEDGELYSEHGEQVMAVLERGRDSIAAILPEHPDYAFELERRTIELRNMQMIKNLAHHEKLIEFSMVPDAVRNGETTISGYDRKRLKMIVRISERVGDRVETLHFSLDGSNMQAVKAAADMIGHDLPIDQGSEAILAAPAHITDAHGVSADDIAECIRSAYDESLAGQFGGQWYAGRPPMSLQDGLAFIESQPDLIEQHMSIIKGIDKRIISAQEKISLMEMARYDFAAALDDRLQGRHVTSVSDSGDVARSENRSYDGDCPVGEGAASNAVSMESTLQQAGFMQGEAVRREINGEQVTHVMKCVECPYCKKSVDALVTKTFIACPQADGCGMVLNKKTGLAGKTQKQSSPVSTADQKKQVPSEPAQSDSIGRAVEYVETKYVFGGAEKLYRHKETGTIGTLDELELAA